MLLEIKSKTVDDYLTPIREQIKELVPKNSSVIDIGCGTGNQLRVLSPKIKSGLGIDKSTSLIEYSQENSEELRNLEFRVENIKNLPDLSKYNVAILSMVLHSLDIKTKEQLLTELGKKIDRIIIADYTKSESFVRNCLIYLEESFSGHFWKFHNYLRNDKLTNRSYNTFDSGIKIWEIAKE